MGLLCRAIWIAFAIGTAVAWQDDPLCGKPTVPLTDIVGGEPAVPGEYPWMAAMIINKGYFGCGATLISPEWIVTAAHCLPIRNLPQAYDFILGQPYLNGSLGPNAQFIEVSEIYVHPNYTGSESIYDDWTAGMDIALMKMSEPYNITDYVRTVCVPDESYDSFFMPGISATVTGWGATREGGDVSEFLLEVDVTIVDQEECRQNYYPEPITDDMICAGELKGGKDACQGDSGGPMVSQISGVSYLAGIVSWGYGCAREYTPGVYTRVTAFEDWLTPVFDGGEIEVDNTCAYNKFMCTDGWCTDYSYKCNGDFDGCYLGSDENFCESPAKFFDHMYLVQLTPESVKRTIQVTRENECAMECVADTDGCLAFDLYYQGFENYSCDLAGTTFESFETDGFNIYLIHFEIEKFPFPSETERISYMPGRIASPKWLPAYEVTTSGFVWIINPKPNNFTDEPYNAINIRFAVNHNNGPTECSSEDTVNAVAIRAGPDFTSPAVNRWCLNVLPEEVLVPGNIARIEFLSADPTQFGFVAEYYGAFDCDNEFTTSPGRINSPLYPENYPDDTRCTTLMTAEPDQAIILVFSDFDLESDGTDDCSNDFDTVSIYDSDHEDESRLLGRFCGNNYQSYVRSSGPNMFVVFKSDLSVNRRGYQATFSFIPNIACDETFTVAPGVIASPNYPEEYPSDAICRKYMMAPPGSNVRLTIQDFRLEASLDCTWDYMSIYDSNTGDEEKLIGTYCGTDLEQGAVFEATGQDMFVLFVSDGSINDKGFQAMFEFVTANETGCDAIYTSPGSFSSPNYPSYYPNNIVCQTRITAPADQVVFLSMKDFQLEDDYANCVEDYDTFSVYDSEYADPDRLIGTYCGDAVPTYFTSSGTSIFVVFKTDVSNARRGFSATFVFRDEPIPPVSPPPPVGGSECGRQNAPLQPETKIVGGKAAQEGEWPWQGALYMLDDYFICGVSLLNADWVITAAHCVDVLNKPSDYSILMGTNSLLQRHENNTQVVQVADIFINPNFVKFENDYDAALLKLATPFTMTDYVHPICVPPSEWNYYVTGGVQCTVTGWGATFQGGIPIQTLYEVEVPLYDQQDCANSYSPEPITDQMVCAGYPWGAKDACTADDGGPLVSNIGDQWYLVGVVSWGEGCAQQLKPHVYSRVTMLEDWIAPIFEGRDPDRNDIGVCEDDEFKCSDGWCIDYQYKCDNDENSDGPGCYSRSDEEFCDSSTIYFDPMYNDQQLQSGSIRGAERDVATPDACADLCLQETSPVCLQFDTYGVGPVKCRLGQPPYQSEPSTISDLIHFEIQPTPASGSTLTAVNGRIASDRFSQSSAAAASYYWIVSPDESDAEELTTTSFTFGQVHSDPSDVCNSDFTTGSYITLRSGPNLDSPIAERHCLNDIPEDFTAVVPSTMSVLEFEVTDETMYGFVADYNVYWSCDKTYDQAPTVITSPNYPLPYPNDVTCRTRITAPQDFQVLIYLRDIQLEDSGEDCRFDWDVLTIYDSNMEDPLYEIGQYCDDDYDTPFSLRSTGTDMLLVFKTDPAVAMAGYEAAFYFVPAVTSTPTPGNETDACGVQTAVLEPELFIVGGKPAQEGEWPWQAGLYWYNNFICGGALLTEEWVITIASCVPDPDPAVYDLVLGTNSLEDFSDNLQFRGVSEIYMHPQYDFFNLDYDVALLKLSEPVMITDFVRTVCLPSENMDQYFPQDTICTATGWGEDSQTGPNNEELYEVNIPIINQGQCETLYDPTPITENMLCAGALEGGSGVCRDDAGGPLVSTYNGQYYLVGIPFFSRGCAEPNYPAVFMRMTAFEEWISDVIAGNITDGVECDNIFTEAPGDFSSPFYPENYPNNVTCRTQITAPIGNRVYVDMRDFRLENDGSTCSNDFDTFSVYDSDYADPMELLGTFCGTVVDDYFISSGRSLYIVFKSDTSVTQKGFTAAFFFLPESGCDKEITEAPGMIASPLYPGNYPNNVECTTILTAPEGETVTLQFRDFNLEDDINQCQQDLDTLKIYDGDTPDEENLMGVFCGNSIPERFDSTGRSMVLVFKTDGRASDTGYEASYYFIPPTREPVTEPVTPPLNQPNCGMQKVTLEPEINIVGGQEAQDGEWPWQAAIYADNSYICGGSLLHSRWVVTTAQCMRATGGKTLTVAVGTNTRDGFPDTVQEGTVASLFIHPEFNIETNDFDVVLLKMRNSFTMNNFVQAVCVPSGNMDSRFDTGTMCMATGWGARFEGGPYVNNLNEVDLTIESQPFCTQHYYPDLVTETMLCAGPMEGGKGVCEGDEGGPLVASIGNRWFLVGMSSWGRGCALEFFPSIFTRVSAVADWIAPIFEGQDPDQSEPTPDPLKGIEDELDKLRDQSDIYMKAMFGLVGGVVLALLILIYVAYSNSQQNSRLKDKLNYLNDDSEDDARGGIGMALPATSTNVYEMNAPKGQGQGGVDNEAVEIEIDETKPKDDDKKEEETSLREEAATAKAEDEASTAPTTDKADDEASAAPKAAEPPKKQDMGTDNPEFIKYPKE